MNIASLIDLHEGSKEDLHGSLDKRVKTLLARYRRKT